MITDLEVNVNVICKVDEQRKKLVNRTKVRVNTDK